MVDYWTVASREKGAYRRNGGGLPLPEKKGKRRSRKKEQRYREQIHLIKINLSWKSVERT